MKKQIILSLAMFAALSVGAHAQKIVIKGSDTLGAKLVPLAAEAYKNAGNNVKFEIAAEGSTTGIAAITEGTADIGMSSRRAKATEVSMATGKGVNMKPIIVSYDGMGVIVNASNPITKLSKKEVEAIFTGDAADWSAVGGSGGTISIYTRNTASGTYQDFKDLAMKKRDYAPTSQKMAGNEQIASEVAKNKNGIGYVGLAYIKTPGIKVVSIDGVLPSKATVQSKSYPYARPNFFYTNGDAQGEAKKFIDFMVGPKGQKIVEEVGFVPIN